jgi:phthiocerol/phenolphthiocerol synthesis type-I polyketide synthase E
VNGPSQCTVTGPADLVARFAREQADRTDRAIETRILRIATAGHSSLVEPVMARFAEALAGLALEEPQLPMVSDTTGGWAEPGALRSVDYWVDHLRRPVRFGQALTTLFGSPDLALVDIGPGRTLSTLAHQHPGHSGERLVVHASPHPAEATSALATLLGAVGRLWSCGTHVDLGALHSDERRRRVPLPTYPFERRHFLVPATASERRETEAAGDTPASWIGSPAATAANTEAAPGGATGDAMGDATGGATGDAMGGATGGAMGEGRQDGQGVLGAVLDAFGKALGVPDVEAHDSFLDLGGDSLLATKLAAWARAEFQVPVSAADLLRSMNAAALACLIQERMRTAENVSRRSAE